MRKRPPTRWSSTARSLGPDRTTWSCKLRPRCVPTSEVPCRRSGSAFTNTSLSPPVSAEAAPTVRRHWILAQAAWGVRLHPSERLDAALRLGADVPFFSAGHPACLVSGVGERLQPLGAPDPQAGIVLVTLPERLSTSAVFAAFDAGPKADNVAGGRVDELARMLSSPIDGTTLAMTTDMLRDANDLWPAATRLSPSLAGAREAASAFLGRSLLLTGSGPTLFAVYPSAKAAARAADHLRAEDLPQLHGAAILATSTT